MSRNRPFTLVMSPGQRLEVLAPDVVTAIPVARDALQYLQGASYVASSAAVSQGEQTEYTLTCLLCGLVNPRCSGKSDLVAMQEHHMEAHGFNTDDFRLALCVSSIDDREHFIWAFAPAVAAMLNLPQLCYLRAVKKKAAIVQPADQSQDAANFTTLVHTSSFDSTPTLQEVYVTGEDAHAWYGYSRRNAREGDPLVWPRGEWELAEAESTLQ